MSKLEVRGSWRDKAELELIRTTLEAVIPEGQTWTLDRAKGDERILTYDPSRPLEPMNGRPLRKMQASDMRNKPRFVYWNNAADDLRFSASTLLEMVLMVGIYNEVGEARIRREMTFFDALPD